MGERFGEDGVVVWKGSAIRLGLLGKTRELKGVSFGIYNRVLGTGGGSMFLENSPKHRKEGDDQIIAMDPVM